MNTVKTLNNRVHRSCVNVCVWHTNLDISGIGAKQFSNNQQQKIKFLCSLVDLNHKKHEHQHNRD